MDRMRRIELLVRAAEAGSFAKAARSLDLTPSAVSHAIADLEKGLGVSLFHRTTRQLRLTEEGEGVYRRGCELLRQLAELESGVRKTERLTGTLRVGVAVPLSRNVIMPRLSTFLRRHPQLRLEFYIQWQPKEMHVEGVDVLLHISEPPASELIARKVAQIRHSVYASPQYLKLAGIPRTPEDLLEHSCLAMKRPDMKQPLEAWEFERGDERKVIQVAPRVVTNDRDGLVAAVLAGSGLMRVGCFDPYLISSGQLHRVLTDWTCPPGFPIFAMYRKTARTIPKVIAFLKFVEEAFAAFDPEEITLLHQGREVTGGRSRGRAQS
ncbi:MAG TPA: LysR substrate-binding domain-containing protein [Burkholderiales bacterium]|nr:LysR substrate-binding domain-containing protein [Burkholderiales bacterium]